MLNHEDGSKQTDNGPESLPEDSRVKATQVLLLLKESFQKIQSFGLIGKDVGGCRLDLQGKLPGLNKLNFGVDNDVSRIDWAIMVNIAKSVSREGAESNDPQLQKISSLAEKWAKLYFALIKLKTDDSEDAVSFKEKAPRITELFKDALRVIADLDGFKKQIGANLCLMIDGEINKILASEVS